MDPTVHVSYETDGEIVGGGNPNSNYSDVRHFWKKNIWQTKNMFLFDFTRKKHTYSCKIVVCQLALPSQHTKRNKLTDHISIPHILWMDFNEIHWRDQRHI